MGSENCYRKSMIWMNCYWMKEICLRGLNCSLIAWMNIEINDDSWSFWNSIAWRFNFLRNFLFWRWHSSLGCWFGLLYLAVEILFCRISITFRLKSIVSVLYSFVFDWCWALFINGYLMCLSNLPYYQRNDHYTHNSTSCTSNNSDGETLTLLCLGDGNWILWTSCRCFLIASWNHTIAHELSILTHTFLEFVEDSFLLRRVCTLHWSPHNCGSLSNNFNGDHIRVRFVSKQHLR